ncbi:hypothetical protein ABW636_07535 [Aquimarina sp. 2201CG1-2-11]|uniref:hypothetical protein n=1 Tax=Aquimarina discodermiae TaxID=3231043 RepID=UPI003461E146
MNMKISSNFKKYLVVTALALFIASCEKSELNEQASVSEDKTEKLNDENSIIFHKSYSGDLSEKEANAKFEVDLKIFNENRKISEKKSFVWQWYSKLSVKTGTLSNSQTNGTVKMKALYNRGPNSAEPGLRGTLLVNRRTLDNPENGQWDFYIFRHIEHVVGWVKIENVEFILDENSNDGWFLERFQLEITPSLQQNSSSGSSILVDVPKEWLDNDEVGYKNTYKVSNDSEEMLLFN